jgi:menaquinone-dependent protoporphyrinogen oxidase
MQPVLIVYATQEGHTRRVAERVAARLGTRGAAAEVLDVRDGAQHLDLSAFSGVIVAAAVHSGKHAREIVGFVRSHRGELARAPTALLSLSLSQAGAEDVAAAPESRARAARNVQDVIDRFVAQTGWRPDRVRPVAGALLYTRSCIPATGFSFVGS